MSNPLPNKEHPRCINYSPMLHGTLRFDEGTTAFRYEILPGPPPSKQDQPTNANSYHIRCLQCKKEISTRSICSHHCKASIPTPSLDQFFVMTPPIATPTNQQANPKANKQAIYSLTQVKHKFFIFADGVEFNEGDPNLISLELAAEKGISLTVFSSNSGFQRIVEACHGDPQIILSYPKLRELAFTYERFIIARIREKLHLAKRIYLQFDGSRSRNIDMECLVASTNNCEIFLDLVQLSDTSAEGISSTISKRLDILVPNDVTIKSFITNNAGNVTKAVDILQPARTLNADTVSWSQSEYQLALDAYNPILCQQNLSSLFLSQFLFWTFQNHMSIAGVIVLIQESLEAAFRKEKKTKKFVSAKQTKTTLELFINECSNCIFVEKKISTKKDFFSIAPKDIPIEQWTNAADVAIMHLEMFNLKMSGFESDAPSETQVRIEKALALRCAVHSSMLALADFRKADLEFNSFISHLFDIVVLLRSCQFRKKHPLLPICPSCQQIKWSSFAECATFCTVHKDEVNAFLASVPEGSLLNVDSDFFLFSEILARFDTFIKCIESPYSTLALLHESFLLLSADFEKTTSKAKSLLLLLTKRLSDNGTLALAKLAHTLSPKGMSDFRKLYGGLTTDFVEMEHLEQNDKARALQKRIEINSMTNTLNVIIGKLGLPNEAAEGVLKKFADFLDERCRSNEPNVTKYHREPTFQFWMELLIKAQSRLNESEEILAEIGIILSVTPISESSCERVFSHLKQIHSAYRSRMDFKLVRAMLRIKMWCLQRQKMFPKDYK